MFKPHVFSFARVQNERLEQLKLSAQEHQRLRVMQLDKRVATISDRFSQARDKQLESVKKKRLKGENALPHHLIFRSVTAAC